MDIRGIPPPKYRLHRSVVMKAITHSNSSNSAYYRNFLSNRPHPLKSLDAMATIVTCHRGQEICREAHPAEHWYFVISGVVRRCVLRPDGRRQIVGLLLPGDFFGFTAGDEYDYTAEAVAEGTVLAGYPHRRVESLADSDPSIARELRQITFEAMSRLQAQLLILGRITALEKVGSFILEMESRLSHGRDDDLTLPVSRYDIADYLAVSVETVSRSLTDLKHRGVIKLSGTRMVKIVDRAVLEDGEHDECTSRLKVRSRGTATEARAA
jgi:CRP/FNR family nitrogen fixation transcriptional regulator